MFFKKCRTQIQLHSWRGSPPAHTGCINVITCLILWLICLLSGPDVNGAGLRDITGLTGLTLVSSQCHLTGLVQVLVLYMLPYTVCSLACVCVCKQGQDDGVGLEWCPAVCGSERIWWALTSISSDLKAYWLYAHLSLSLLPCHTHTYTHTITRWQSFILSFSSFFISFLTNTVQTHTCTCTHITHKQHMHAHTLSGEYHISMPQFDLNITGWHEIWNQNNQW